MHSFIVIALDLLITTGNNHLVVFGGMSTQPDSINPDEHCVLNDVRFYNLSTRHWLPASSSSLNPGPFTPRARYAHLSSVTADRLFIIGGQDFFNTWLDDICVFDLVSQTWVQRRDYPRHCGTYRSVAISSTKVVRSPQDEIQTSHSSLILGPAGSRFRRPPSTPLDGITSSESLTHLSYSVIPTEDYPCDIYLYSNYNVRSNSNCCPQTK
jgi:leucine-zipper-like transcriptional regulator 1